MHTYICEYSYFTFSPSCSFHGPPVRALYLQLLVMTAIVMFLIPSTPNEKKILQNPHELEGGYAAYDDRASTANAASKV